MANEDQPKKNQYVQLVRGCPFPGAAWFKKEILEEIMDFVPNPGDIIISSYPKTGTTWLQYIVLQIISKGNLFPAWEDMDKICPYLEMVGISGLEPLKPPRMCMHHIPYNLVQKNENAKVLYIYRRPEDTLVSYYHFLKGLREDKMDFDLFFENFLSGNIGYGRYFEHIMSYLDHKDDDNLLLISYEKLHANRKEEILRIAKFLGEEYARSISENESILNSIIEKTSFNHMKSNLSASIPMISKEDKCAGLKPKKIDFFRKGTVGDGKNLLSPEQMKHLKDIASKSMRGTGIFEDWESG
ncbi:hypothetical protein NPIL_572501 [Nephila pilipes]|uniref:Sulfotransferase domain-containing protein n=1 Tax=Nephila pilipes TaxID=299642 RepID=A0A8X6TLV6_NEPPI|nr:hypothetical protein NPIL_572501 [Nephila pilipes]